MPDVTGGLRDRLIATSFTNLVESMLDQLGWLTPNPDERPSVTYRVEPLRNEEYEKIEPILVVATVETVDPDDEQEMGSSRTEDTHLAFVDIYANADYIGKHIAGDIRCGLAGELPDLGRDWPTLEVTDLATGSATPDTLFQCEIRNIVQDRSHRPTEMWQRHYYSVTAEIADER